jgi:hypothetical protein
MQISALRVHSMLVTLFLATTVQARECGGATETLRQRWVDTASAGLDARAVDTLHRIRGANRQLLALRAYLRAGDSLAARWSWSEDHLTRYPTTPEGKAAAADIDAVVAAFAKANPGYDLQVNRQPRSLEAQLAHWNDNESVAAVSETLAEYLDRRLGRTAPPSTMDLRSALVQWTPDSAAALAAPGLSAHGQGRAFDFAVAHNGEVVAGLEAASAHQRWDEAGWTRKLHDAVVASGKPFVGPLQSPYEPWHYAYTPP